MLNRLLYIAEAIWLRQIWHSTFANRQLATFFYYEAEKRQMCFHVFLHMPSESFRWLIIKSRTRNPNISEYLRSDYLKTKKLDWKDCSKISRLFWDILVDFVFELNKDDLIKLDRFFFFLSPLSGFVNHSKNDQEGTRIRLPW